MQIYLPPATKWWRREHGWHFSFYWWPRWLAQLLCDHKTTIEWLKTTSTIPMMMCCFDCYKLVNQDGAIGKNNPGYTETEEFEK